MTNYSVIENKISSIKKYLKILAGYRKYTRKRIESDVTLKAAVERYLYLVSQAAIDLAEAVISIKGLRKPSTMTESFYILAEERIISAAITKKMVKMVGFRNIMAHEYEKVDYTIVYEVLQNRLKDIEVFVKAVKNKISL